MGRIESPLKRILQVVCITLLVVLAGPPLLGLGLGALLVSGWEHESDQRIAPAREVLQDVGMESYMGSYYVLTGPDTAIFHLSKYDNHVDHTDLRAALIADAATTAGWTVAPVTVEEYAALLPLERTFLLPKEGLVFDASYHAENGSAFFDQETGLIVYSGSEKTGQTKRLRLDGVSVPTGAFRYGMETHGGFHGDGQTYWAFIVPEESRAVLKAALSAHEYWHTGNIPQTEYARLHESCFYEMPGLFPDPSVVFDRWYYADDYARQYPDEEVQRRSSECFPSVMQEIGAGRTLNWSVGFYDENTGLFIWYEYDS